MSVEDFEKAKLEKAGAVFGITPEKPIKDFERILSAEDM